MSRPPLLSPLEEASFTAGPDLADAVAPLSVFPPQLINPIISKDANVVFSDVFMTVSLLTMCESNNFCLCAQIEKDLIVTEQKFDK